MARLLGIAGVFAALVVSACSSGTPGGGECAPGLLLACTCADGVEGARACGPDRRFEACGCGTAGVVPDPTGQADYLIDFGARVVGETARGVLPLRNAGSAALQFQAEPVAPPFAAEGTAPVRVEPGQRGELAWTFVPTAVGSHSVVARVTSGGDDFTVRLAGVGFEAALACEPAAVGFGDVWPGSEGRREVTCVNAAAHPWALVAGPISGPDADSFAVAPAPSDPVAPGEAWRLEVTAVPTRTGHLTASLRLRDVTGRRVAALPLEVLGLGRGIVVVPSVDFGYVAPGGVGRQELSVGNSGPEPVRIVDIVLETEGQPRFGWAPTSFPIVVPGAGGSSYPAVMLELSFRPEEAELGTRSSGTLVIRTDDPTQPRIDVALTGFAGGPHLRCSPSLLEFGSVATGMPITRAVACTNDGTDDPGRTDDRLRVFGVNTQGGEFTAAGREPFSPQGYEVGETFLVDVTYAPADDGLDLAQLRLHTDAINATDEVYTVALSGHGVALPPCDFAVAPEQLRFGLVEKDRTATLEFAIRNRLASGGCMVRELRLAAEACDGAFGLAEAPAPLILVPPGGELRVPVTFRPTEHRVYACEARFEVSHPTARFQVLPISGAAQESCVRVEPSDHDFGVVRPTCSALDREFRIVNGCGEAHTIGVALNEGPSDEFALRSVPAAGTRLASGESARFTVAYQPGDAGVDLGSVLVAVDGAVEPLLATFRGEAAMDATQTDSFTQTAPKVDVLWVIDDATSTWAELELQYDPQAFLDHPQTHGIDFQIGVTSASLSTAGGCSGEDGRLVPYDDALPRILRPTTPGLAAAFARNIQAGFCTAAGQGLEAAYRALHPPVIDRADDPRHPEYGDGNYGFLRPEAHLSIIAVTAGVDVSPGTDDAYAAAFRALKGERNTHLFDFHAIAGDPGTGCDAGAASAAAGDRLASMVNRIGSGVFRSYCSTTWPTMVAEVSAAAFDYPRCFLLRGRPEDTNGDGRITPDAGEVAVRVDGIEAPPDDVQGRPVWRYSPDQMAVCFESPAAPATGTPIDIEYRVACLAR